MRYAIYVRVSTQEQKAHGLSVDNQIEALKEYVDNNNGIIVGIYNDAGISARKKYTKRPALLKLIKDVEAGEIEQIIFTKLDRWFRSVADYYDVQKILDAHNVSWRAIWEDYETETSAGVFKTNIMLSVAQNEADNASVRVRAIQDFKRQRGDYIGSAPTGYKVVGRDLVIDEDKREGMSALFCEYLKTYSIKKAMDVGALYGVKFDRLHLLKLIRNPVYCGEASNGYKCEPYITKAQHEAILEHIGTNARIPKAQGRVYLFSGIVFCGICGKRMAGHAVTRTHADGSKITYLKYNCQLSGGTTKLVHPHIQITEDALERYLLSNLDALNDYEIKRVDMVNASKDELSLMKRKKALEAKLERLAVLYEEGDIDTDTYKLKRDNVKLELSTISISPEPYPVELPNNWLDIYDDLDKEHRRAFWLDTVKSITVTNENKANPVVVFCDT